MNYRETEFFFHHGITCEKVLARSANSVVYLVHSKQVDGNVILKKCNTNLFSDKELDAYIASNNQYIVNLYRYYHYSNYLYLLIEYCPSNLEKLVMESENFTGKTLQNAVKDVILAIKSCHDIRFALQDFDVKTFLVASNDKIKLNIYSISRNAQDERIYAEHSLVSTTYFAPPEVLFQTNYHALRADIWVLGCILYFMATKTLPFSSKDIKEFKQKVKSLDYDISAVQNDNLKELIIKCLKIEPKERTSTRSLLNSKYFGMRLNNNNLPKIDRQTAYYIPRNPSFVHTNLNISRETPNTPLITVNTFL